MLHCAARFTTRRRFGHLVATGGDLSIRGQATAGGDLSLFFIL
jgi:hypothetical protein